MSFYSVNYYFQVSFSLKVILYVAKKTQSTVTELLRVNFNERGVSFEKQILNCITGREHELVYIARCTGCITKKVLLSVSFVEFGFEL